MTAVDPFAPEHGSCAACGARQAQPGAFCTACGAATVAVPPPVDRRAPLVVSLDEPARKPRLLIDFDDAAVAAPVPVAPVPVAPLPAPPVMQPLPAPPLPGPPVPAPPLPHLAPPAARSSSVRVVARNPWAVLGLYLITLGLYHYYWYFQVNREMSDLGRERNDATLGTSPGRSLLAISPLTIFTLYISILWSYVSAIGRAQRAQQTAGLPVTLSGGVMVLLAIFTLGLGCAPYYQSELNKVWRQLGLAR